MENRISKTKKNQKSKILKIENQNYGIWKSWKSKVETHQTLKIEIMISTANIEKFYEIIISTVNIEISKHLKSKIENYDIWKS